MSAHGQAHGHFIKADPGMAHSRVKPMFFQDTAVAHGGLVANWCLDMLGNLLMSMAAQQMFLAQTI
ncbi:unnamed protein product [Clonostachys rosea f. rosea IK726]|uniref:Uncharacterized protein n=1 Tax=Clonostachys rosea f. rosea IK726 TaxID=1349383 RepID=A0ACA9TJQ6_BIOOC|nr:unnamed protein product [Clonostachys rosea f. rosea IK726]